MLTEKPIRTLIAARSGLMRNALVAYLRAAPPDHRRLPRRLHPGRRFFRRPARLLGLLNAQRPDLNCIVLSDSLVRATAVVAAGARHALLKGFLDDQLRDAITGSGPPSAPRATGAGAKPGGASR